MVHTYRGIIREWKRKGGEELHPEFAEWIREWLEFKRRAVMNTSIKDMNRWTAQVILILEIGMLIDPYLFKADYLEWKAAIGKEWKADLTEMTVTWT